MIDYLYLFLIIYSFKKTTQYQIPFLNILQNDHLHIFLQNDHVYQYLPFFVTNLLLLFVLPLIFLYIFTKILFPIYFKLYFIPLVFLLSQFFFIHSIVLRLPYFSFFLFIWISF